MALKKVQEWVNKVGLTLHPDKTHIGNANWFPRCTWESIRE